MQHNFKQHIAVLYHILLNFGFYVYNMFMNIHLFSGATMLLRLVSPDCTLKKLVNAEFIEEIIQISQVKFNLPDDIDYKVIFIIFFLNVLRIGTGFCLFKSNKN